MTDQELIKWLGASCYLAFEDGTNDYSSAQEAADRIEELVRQRDEQKTHTDAAYLERNKVVALLASIYPSGIKRTAIEGWSEDWHGCVYINFPWGQGSWHHHDSQDYLFSHLPAYSGEWDGHSTEDKYAAIVEASRKDNNANAKLTKVTVETCWKCDGSGMVIGDGGDPCICNVCKYDGVVPVADRIEELLRDRKFILDERDRTFAFMLARAETAEDKLAKAVEALREIADGSSDNSEAKAKRVLAELEGKP